MVKNISNLRLSWRKIWLYPLRFPFQKIHYFFFIALITAQNVLNFASHFLTGCKVGNSGLTLPLPLFTMIHKKYKKYIWSYLRILMLHNQYKSLLKHFECGPKSSQISPRSVERSDTLAVRLINCLQPLRLIIGFMERQQACLWW